MILSLKLLRQTKFGLQPFQNHYHWGLFTVRGHANRAKHTKRRNTAHSKRFASKPPCLLPLDDACKTLARRRSLRLRTKLSSHVIEPIISRTRVGPEGLRVTLAIVVKDGAVKTKGAGVGSIDQRRGIAGAHLEQDAIGKFAQRFAAKEAADVVESVAGQEDVNTLAGTFSD